VLLPKFSCLIMTSEASCKKALTEGIEDSGIRNSHNNWDRLELFYTM